MRRPEIQNLERLRHWQGERLKQADFADQAAYDRRRGAWHNRSIHEIFGVVMGLTVSTAAGKVTVEPGLAYDAQGNPMWLAQKVELLLPETAADQTWYLVLGTPHAGCGCGCSGADAGLEWVTEDECTSCDGLPLGSTNTSGGLNPCYPKHIRPLARPILHPGETVRGRTPWEIWEVSVPGQSAKMQAGVQTRIDTSASGFTTTPHYFAELQAPVWSSSGSSRPDFAPTYLAHVANPTPQGFLFRLLLKDIAMRSFGIAQATARVSAITKASAEELDVDLEEPSPFIAGDAVTLVRPRGTRASVIRLADDELLQLDSTLGLAVGDRVALGNLPRISAVSDFETSQRTKLQLSQGVAIGSGDVVAFMENGGPAAGVARVESANTVEALLDRLWTLPASQELRVSLAGTKTARVTAPPEAQGAGLKLQVTAGRIANGDWVAALPRTGQQLSAPVKVTSVNGTEVVLANIIEGLAPNSRLLPLNTVFTIKGLKTEAGTGVAHVQSPGRFVEGDLVAVAEHSASLATVLLVSDSDITLETAADFQLATGEHLVAANWEAAAAVQGAFPTGTGGQYLWVANLSLFRPGDLLLKWQNPGIPPDDPPELHIDQMSRVGAILPFGSTRSGFLELDKTPAPFTLGDVILAARFPFVTSLVSTGPNNRLLVAGAGLRAGDWIAPLGFPGEFRIIVLKEQIAPDQFTASEAMNNLPIGTSLGTVHFATIGTVDTSTAGDPANSVRLTETFDFRSDGDFLAVWTHFADNGCVALVKQSAGSKLVLTAGQDIRFAGDGIVPDGLIDGGVLALASFRPDQRLVRLDPGEVMNTNDDTTASGPGLLENDQSIPMSVDAFNLLANRVTLSPRVGVADYSFRPERLTLVSSFNERFVEEFAVFAQTQGLYVAWTACQDSPRSAIELSDPPADPCDDSIEEDPCPCQA